MRELNHGELGNTRRNEDSQNRPDNLRLVFIGPKQASYQCLCGATRDHFRDADVVLLDRFPGTQDPNHDVGLVLLGASVKAVGLATVQECRRHFPDAAIAVAVQNGLPTIEPVLIERRLIQGVLSTTLPLDVWLALVRLVLAGGEYLPQEGAWPAAHFESLQRTVAAAFRTPRSDGGSIEAAAAPTRHGLEHDGTMANGLDTLTAREHEILMLVSAGFQNKLIADRMGLSEHTVKAHVHNLIAKLGVTNRTQAAAYLHEHKSDRQRVPPGRGDPPSAALPG
ncbi:MAG: response regulator transcription factor [Kaiparowitsia implicata GSE-PSE-MK54-09C]|nr:response regulator transcription factor [Kaiparowitsia implicata GSE-PSE-MK54-09C]